MESLLLRISEVAEALGVSKSTVYAMAAANEIPSIKIRGVIRVPAEALKNWIMEKVEGGKDHA
jgi:excisionase family DNA binding protein